MNSQSPMGPRPLAVVTGGGSGIGSDLAIALAQAGWDVAISYIRSKEGALQVLEKVLAAGASGFAQQCDVGLKTDVDAFFDAAAVQFGKVPDLLVNNAGVQTWSSLLELREEDWDAVIRTNLKGCFLNTQKAARMMVTAGKGGTIINIGSGCNKVPFPNLVDYTASKGGVDQFTKVAAIELGPHNIRVNCVAPGAIEIERTRVESPDYAKTWSQVTPLRRVGLSRDVAEAVLFLASSQASFITGQTLYVDGGVFTRPNWPYPLAERPP